MVVVIPGGAHYGDGALGPVDGGVVPYAGASGEAGVGECVGEGGSVGVGFGEILAGDEGNVEGFGHEFFWGEGWFGEQRTVLYG